MPDDLQDEETAMRLAGVGDERERTLVVVHLEDDPVHRARFRRVFESRVESELVGFFNEQFGGPEFFRDRFGIEFSFRVRLEQYPTVEALCHGNGDRLGLIELRRDGARPTAVGRDTILFVVDYFLPAELPEIVVDGEPFVRWLDARFPHVPAILLTVGPSLGVEKPAHWKYFNKDLLENPDDVVTHLLPLCHEWWSPAFSRALHEYATKRGACSWHTPGHNAGNAFLRSPFQRRFYSQYKKRVFRADLSVSVSSLGDLSEPDRSSPLNTSQRRSAEVFGAEETLFVTNGTSTSNKAVLMTLMRPGDLVLLDRNCHKSVHQAVVMAGVLPLYLPPAFNRRLGVWSPLSLTLLERLLTAPFPPDEATEGANQADRLQKPRMLVLTSCTYEGVLYPLGQLARRCEQQEMLLVADEAWGPYLRFHPFYMQRTSCGLVERYNATGAGAHFVVHSTHKALAAFSQASMVHISSRFRELTQSLKDGAAGWEWLKHRFAHDGTMSYERFRHELFEVLRYWHSTSPHYPILETLDRSGVQMRLEGMRLLDERLGWLDEFAGNFDCMVGLADIVGVDRMPYFSGYLKDPLKLVVAGKDARAVTELKEQLKLAGIQWEKDAEGCIEFLLTIGSHRGHWEELLGVLGRTQVRGLLARPNVTPADFDFQLTAGNPDAEGRVPGEVEVLPRTAAAAEGELVPLESSAGRICGQMLTPYPPGIPIFLPGLRITVPMIDSATKAANGGEVHGLHRHAGCYFVKVMRQDEEKAAIAAPGVMRDFRRWVADNSGLICAGDRGA